MAHETLRSILEGLRWVPETIGLKEAAMTLAAARLVNQIDEVEYLIALLELNEAIEDND